ncbi:MAG TPA: hypothetical protein DGT23_28795, partial [Micromonosporaceae bacterium]|nr:hypothetical protein [Micromonosporaceae bacterium]
MVEFSLLGSVRAVHEGRELELGRRQERCLLGLLLLEAGRVVTTDRIVGLLWTDVPPATARATVHSYVARLRSVLAPYDVRVATRGAGYVAEVDPQTVDVHRFTQAMANAQQETNPQARAEMLGEALALWHGPLLADVADEQLRGRLGARLIEQRLLAQEWWAEAALAVGRHGDVLTGLTEVVESHPTQERLVGLLMQARYRSGDVAGALAAFGIARRSLADQLGIEPGDELSELHLAILNRKALSRVPDAPRPRQLPPDVATFSGRAAQLRLLDDLLPADAGHLPRTVVISAIAGTPGVGKTALAVHWAHRMAGRFPDGELYVNLRGFDPAAPAMSTEEAVRGFLDALQVPQHRIPAGLQAQCGLFRSLMADKRVLIILDNARDADQVRPLLPGSPGCVVLVTSRNQLTGLVATEGAHSLALGLLNAAEARQLLIRRLGEARVVAEPEATEELIVLCSGLPLALAIASARAATHPHLPLTSLVNDLRDVHGGLAGFASDDLATDVRAVFSCSYQALSPDAARLFRLLGTHPGPHLGLPAAAGLAGWSPAQTRLVLAELERAHLVTQQAQGRFGFHDLLRAYARELTGEIDSDVDSRQAVHRMLDHYLHTAHQADLLLDAHRDGITPVAALAGAVPEDLADFDAAMAWYTSEHAVLLAVLNTAAATGFDVHVWQLAWTTANFFERRGHWHDWLTSQGLALAAATRLADGSGQARVHRSLARAHARLGRHDEAHVHLRSALDLYRHLDDNVGQAYAHLNLNVVLNEQHRYNEALFHARQALDRYRAAEHVVGQALSLNAIGWCHTRLGDHRQALANCRR